jgi:hypothetical protein
MRVEFINCADETTPEGAYAYVAKSARVGTKVGYWSKIGDGAVIPSTASLGSWSDVGHFTKIGHYVEFGPWASVGMDCRVQTGVKFGSHEYVPSGHKRLLSGLCVARSVTHEDRAIHRAFDRMHMQGHGVMSLEQGRWYDEQRNEAAMEVARLLPAYLDRKKYQRPLIHRLLRIEAK